MRLRSLCSLTELVENHGPGILLEDVILSKPTKNLKTDVRITGLLGYFCSGAHCCIYRGPIYRTEVRPKQGCDNPSLWGRKHLRYVSEG